MNGQKKILATFQPFPLLKVEKRRANLFCGCNSPGAKHLLRF